MILSKMNSKKLIFYFILWVGIITTLIGALLTRGNTLSNILFSQSEQVFLDFFESIVYGAAPYSANGSYPPLAYIIYGGIGRLIPLDIRELGGYGVRENQMGLFLFAIYFGLSMVIFSYMIFNYFKASKFEKTLFIITIIFSLPMLFLIERANIIFYTMLFISFFIFHYESEKPFERYLAYISLAIAAGIKIYPALLGLLLIRRKKIKEIFICLFLGILFFFVPFLFLGGINGAIHFFENILYANELLGGELGYGYKINIANTLGWIGYIFHQETIFQTISYILWIILFIFGIVIIIWGKFEAEWKLWSIPILMMILLPGFSFIYTLSFLIIPLIKFLQDDIKKGDNLYAILFSVLFMPMLVTQTSFFKSLNESYYQLNISTMIEGISILMLTILIWGEGIISIIRQLKKQSKNSDQILKMTLKVHE